MEICNRFLSRFIVDPVYEYNPLTFLPRKQYFTVNSTNVVELSIEYCFHVNTTQQLAQYHDDRWYRNGMSINNNNPPKYNSTVLIRQNGRLLFTMEISNINADDFGDYTGTIYTDVYDLTLWCTEYRYSFFPIWWRIRRRYPTAVFYTSLKKYSECIKFKL